MADMMMAAGIDTARDLDLEIAQTMDKIIIGKALADALGYWNRTGIGQAAKVQARTADDVGCLVDIGRGETDLAQSVEDRRQIGAADMRQDQILGMADAQFAARIGLGQI